MLKKLEQLARKYDKKSIVFKAPTNGIIAFFSDPLFTLQFIVAIQDKYEWVPMGYTQRVIRIY